MGVGTPDPIANALQVERNKEFVLMLVNESQLEHGVEKM